MTLQTNLYGLFCCKQQKGDEVPKEVNSNKW